MRNDFCAFILTHGRPDRVHTLRALKRAGYTGKTYIVIDDEDRAEDEYRKKFKDDVLQFCKREIAAITDEGDNFGHRKSTIYARNVMHALARKMGYKYFIQLDDDYTGFEYRINGHGEKNYVAIRTTFDEAICAMVEFYESIDAVTIAMAQGGDYIGGTQKACCRLLRKCMNTFICSVDRPLQFFGHLNEDVNTYVCAAMRGQLMFTVMPIKVVQKQTQANAGGMSEIYLDSGTYVKTFYSIMYQPSCVKVATLADPRSQNCRIHHKINWHHCAPKILREELKKR